MLAFYSTKTSTTFFELAPYHTRFVTSHFVDISVSQISLQSNISTSFNTNNRSKVDHTFNKLHLPSTIQQLPQTTLSKLQSPLPHSQLSLHSNPTVLMNTNFHVQTTDPINFRPLNPSFAAFHTTAIAFKTPVPWVSSQSFRTFVNLAFFHCSPKIHINATCSPDTTASLHQALSPPSFYPSISASLPLSPLINTTTNHPAPLLVTCHPSLSPRSALQ